MDNEAAQCRGLLHLALKLSDTRPMPEQFGGFLAELREQVPFDAATILLLDGDICQILASQGLGNEARTRTYLIQEHPRLETIIKSPGAVRFPLDSTLPDPFDGLLLADPRALQRVHACMGVALHLDGATFGCLTLDALHPDAFDAIPPWFLEALSQLLASALRTALVLERLERESQRGFELARELQGMQTTRPLLGDSPKMQRLRQEIQLVGRTAFPVLVLGETGTGKELVARALHAQSPRASGNWVAINCASLPDSTAESELFGHVRGAFTGADRDRLGKFEMAHQGTLFLDEIGDLPMALQAKILRVLQEGEVQRLGSDRTHRVDVRIIAATHRDLDIMVEQGRFRRDLLHRLKVFPLRVPPLRERRDDVGLLAAWFAETTAQELGCGVLRFAPESLALWEGENWPGNVRELANRVRALMIALHPDSGKTMWVEPYHFTPRAQIPLPEAAIASAPSVLEPSAQLDFTCAVENFKRTYILQALAGNNGNWAGAARTLGMHRSNLHKLAKRLDLLEAAME